MKLESDLQSLSDRLVAQDDHFASHLEQFASNHGAEGVAALLSLDVFDEDRTHEMYTVIHLIESTYSEFGLDLVLCAIEYMEPKDTRLLVHLFARICNSDEYTARLCQIFRTSEQRRRSAIITILHAVAKQFEFKTDIVRRVKSIMSSI